jgi:8-oxo-dGTP pyrophosphatase MutT (NUDIX family)
MNFIGRVLYRIIGGILELLPGWSSRRVRVILVNPQNKILFVRGWISHQKLSLPGGGIGRNESPELAAVREVKEETGIEIHQQDLEYLSTIYDRRIKSKLAIYQCFVSDDGLPALKWQYKLEIIAREWHSADTITDDTDVTTKKAIALALESKN